MPSKVDTVDALNTPEGPGASDRASARCPPKSARYDNLFRSGYT